MSAKTWTLEVREDAEVHVRLNPEPLSLSGALVSPLLTLSIEARGGG